MNEDVKMKFLLIFVFVLTVGGALIPHPKNKEENVDEIVQNENITVALTGDLLWEQGLYDWMDNYQFNGYFDEIKPYLQSDLTIGNHEVPIGGEELGVSGVAYTFNAPKQIADQLKEVGFDFFTLANNHTMDMGMQGIENTMNNLDANKIGHTGEYLTQQEADTISIVDVKGCKIAILSYTYGTNVPSENEFSVPYFLNAYGEFDEDCKSRLKNDVEKAKEQADLVFVAMHWGLEFTYELTPTQIEAANYLNELGVDLIIGNHPHNIQMAETLVNTEGKETIVFYSLGNLVSSAAPVDRASADFQNMYEVGALVNLDIVKEDGYALKNIRIIPVVNQFEHEYTEFKLIPFNKYSEDLASVHYQKEFNGNFTYDWLYNQIESVFEDSNFKIDM